MYKHCNLHRILQKALCKTCSQKIAGKHKQRLTNDYPVIGRKQKVSNDLLNLNVLLMTVFDTLIWFACLVVHTVTVDLRIIHEQLNKYLKNLCKSVHCCTEQSMTICCSKGSARRKKKVLHKTTVGDDKKLQTSLKKLGLNPIPSIEEVGICFQTFSLHLNVQKLRK